MVRKYTIEQEIDALKSLNPVSGETLEERLEESQEEEDKTIHIRSQTDTEAKVMQLAKNVIDYYIYKIYPKKFDAIKAKKLVTADLEMIIEGIHGDDHSFLVTRNSLTDHIHDIFNKDLIGQNYTARTIPTKPEYIEHADDSQDYYDWAYSVSGYEDVSHNVYSEASLLGSSYLMFGARELADGEMIPSVGHTSFFEMFIDPTATSPESARYKIRRLLLPTSDMIETYSFIDFNDKFEGDVDLHEAIRHTRGNMLYDWDFKKIRDIDSLVHKYKDGLRSGCCDGSDKSYIDSIYSDLFSIKQGYNEYNEIIELWEGPKLTVMVNGYEVYSGKNPFGMDPFAAIEFEEAIGSISPRGIYEKVMHLQKKIDMIDINYTQALRTNINPDYYSEVPLELSGKEVARITYTGGGNVYNPSEKGAVSRGKVTIKPLQFVDKDIIGLMRSEKEAITSEAYRTVGVNSLTGGFDARVERVSSVARAKIEGSKSRLKTIKKHINMALNKGWEVWTHLALDGIIKSSTIQKVDDDGKPMYKEIDIDKLAGRFKIILDSESRKTDTLKTRGQDLLNMSTAMRNLLGDQFDARDFAQGILDGYNIKFKVKDKQSQKDMIDEQFDIEMHKLKRQMEMEAEIQKMQAELQGQAQEQQQQAQQQQLPPEDPNSYKILDQNGNPMDADQIELLSQSPEGQAMLAELAQMNGALNTQIPEEVVDENIEQ